MKTPDDYIKTSGFNYLPKSITDLVASRTTLDDVELVLLYREVRAAWEALLREIYTTSRRRPYLCGLAYDMSPDVVHMTDIWRTFPSPTECQEFRQRHQAQITTETISQQLNSHRCGELLASDFVDLTEE